MNQRQTSLPRRPGSPIILLVALVTLLVVSLGCNLPGMSATPTPVVVPPTAPPAPPPVTPLPQKVEEEAINALENQIITVYEAISPSVVNITNRSYAYDMFMRAVPQEGSGSGFVYDDQGHIVTNYHVIENAEELLVTLANGKAYQAKVIGQDPTNDLAVIQIDAEGDLPQSVALADSDQLRVGQFVVAIGNPFGLEQTLTTGVISALGRVIESPDESSSRFIGEAIQTDAAINPGNSGGPLLDLKGRVIGVNSQIISTSGSSAGIGFAVSANTVRRVVPELIARGYYPHPWLGTNMFNLTPATAEIFREAKMNVPVETGLLILEIVSGGPAEKAGIRGGSRMVRMGRYQIPLDGDIIIGIDDQVINDYEDLTVYLETKTVIGDVVQLKLIRDGSEITIPVTLEERPQDQ